MKYKLASNVLTIEAENECEKADLSDWMQPYERTTPRNGSLPRPPISILAIQMHHLLKMADFGSN